MLSILGKSYSKRGVIVMKYNVIDYVYLKSCQ